VRILYYHRTLGDGAEGIHIIEMVKALRHLGHEVRVTGPAGEPHPQAARQRSRWSAVARLIPEPAYELAEIGYNVLARSALAREVRDFRPQVIYDRYNVYSTAAVASGRAHRIPVLLEVNTIAYERTAYEHHRLRMPALANRYERWICNAADHVFAVSTPLARVLSEQHHVDRARLTVLPNGANPETFHPSASPADVRATLNLGNRVVVGFVGILRPWHGIDMFLDAIAMLRQRGRDVHALIVGDGPMEDVLRRKCGEAGIADRVTFTGRVSHDQVRGYVAAMDIAVSPRATFYASPMKILEYMAMGKPVVAPAMENIRDLIDDRRTGLLFTENDPRDLASRVEELILSPELRVAFGAAARREVEDSRNWVANARIVVARAEQVLSRP
jgi:glycosyltransferase involved in cell wall biosynthesis